MRSIRLSLIVYFLLLFGAALGGAAFFSYRSTEQALAANARNTIKLMEAKEKSDSEVLKEQFNKTRNAKERAFDAKLLDQAKTLLAGSKVVWYHHRVESLYVLGALGHAPIDGSFLGPTLPLWQSLNFNGQRAMTRLKPIDLRLQDVDDDLPPDLEPGQYYQTYGPDGQPQEASETLTDLIWSLKEKDRERADDGPFFDDVQLPTGQTVRRVTLKTQAGWHHRGVIVAVPKEFFGKGPFGKGPREFIPPPDKPDVAINVGDKPRLYVQFGLDRTAHDREIAELRAKLNERLPQLHAEMEQARDQLNAELEESRTRLFANLLWMGLATIAAVLVGGFWLVRLGLSPLKRLSDAVSKVSEKDFRLVVDQKTLPRELKPIVERLAGTLEQLKRAFEREKQAAADISHELRTPVAALLTTLAVTLRKPRTADEYREVLEDCQNSGQQIHQLVERLLTLARLDAGADLLRPRDVDVCALADQCAGLVRPLAEARGLRLEVEHSGPAYLRADPDKLREVVTNLLHNAIEYNRPNGAVNLRVERSNGHLDVEVRDTGIGITQEARPHLFERFFRADPSRTSDTPHAGLGLAIVKGYVDLMGGSIQVHSAVGQGSTFRVRLPAGPAVAC
jgi:heavy metal sensor kinase